MMNFWQIFIFTSLSTISVISAAEITHKFRHKGHHKKSHKTTTETPLINSNIPSNIWSILSANAIQVLNNSDDEIKTVPKPSDLSFDEPTHETVKCPGCAQSTEQISDEDLDELRIEYVKNEILHKLRLSERPPKIEKVIDELPEPVQEGHTRHGESSEDIVKGINSNNDDYYAKTTQRMVFLTQETDKCQTITSTSNQPAICFSFQLPSDVDYSTIKSAQLWVFKAQNELKPVMNHTLLLSEVNTTGIRLEPISFIQTDSNNHDWEKMEISTSVKFWLENRQTEHLVSLACDDCKSDVMPISMHHDFKPFIIIDTLPQKNLKRRRRSINCSPGSNECCRDSLYIDFSLIGWDDWIVHPKGYEAYFCRGSCNRIASILKTRTDHSAAFNRFMHASRTNKKKLEMIPCCTGTHYEPLEIIYLDSNNTGTKATLPNMILQSCGCS